MSGLPPDLRELAQRLTAEQQNLRQQHPQTSTDETTHQPERLSDSILDRLQSGPAPVEDDGEFQIDDEPAEDEEEESADGEESEEDEEEEEEEGDDDDDEGPTFDSLFRYLLMTGRSVGRSLRYLHEIGFSDDVREWIDEAVDVRRQQTQDDRAAQEREQNEDRDIVALRMGMTPRAVPEGVRPLTIAMPGRDARPGQGPLVMGLAGRGRTALLNPPSSEAQQPERDEEPIMGGVPGPMPMPGLRFPPRTIFGPALNDQGRAVPTMSNDVWLERGMVEPVRDRRNGRVLRLGGWARRRVRVTRDPRDDEDDFEDGYVTAMEEDLRSEEDTVPQFIREEQRLADERRAAEAAAGTEALPTSSSADSMKVHDQSDDGKGDGEGTGAANDDATTIPATRTGNSLNPDSSSPPQGPQFRTRQLLAAHDAPPPAPTTPTVPTILWPPRASTPPAPTTPTPPNISWTSRTDYPGSFPHPTSSSTTAAERENNRTSVPRDTLRSTNTGTGTTPINHPQEPPHISSRPVEHPQIVIDWLHTTSQENFIPVVRYLLDGRLVIGDWLRNLRDEQVVTLIGVLMIEMGMEGRVGAEIMRLLDEEMERRRAGPRDGF